MLLKLSCIVDPSLMTADGAPQAAVDGLLHGFDVKLEFFGNAVPTWAMYLVVISAVAVLIVAFVLINVLNKKRNTKM